MEGNECPVPSGNRRRLRPGGGSGPGAGLQFNQYKSQIIKEQEEQLLTIAKAVSNSISVYTDFYFADLVDVNTYDEYQTAGRLYLETGEEGPVRKFLTEHMRIQNEDVSNFFSQQRPGEPRGARGPDSGRRDRTYTSVNHFDGKRRTRESTFCGTRRTSIIWDCPCRRWTEVCAFTL